MPRRGQLRWEDIRPNPDECALYFHSARSVFVRKSAPGGCVWAQVNRQGHWQRGFGIKNVFFGGSGKQIKWVLKFLLLCIVKWFAHTFRAHSCNCLLLFGCFSFRSAYGCCVCVFFFFFPVSLWTPWVFAVRRPRLCIPSTALAPCCWTCTSRWRSSTTFTLQAAPQRTACLWRRGWQVGHAARAPHRHRHRHHDKLQQQTS